MFKNQKLISFVVLLTMLFTIFSSNSMSTAKAQDSVVSHQYGNITVTELENRIIVKDLSTNEQVVTNFENNEKTRGTFQDVNGEIKEYYKDEKGNIYLDDVLVLEVVPNELNKNAFSTMATWKQFNTYRTTQSLQQSINSLGLAIVGLVPGLGAVGWFFGAASVIAGLQSLKSSQNEVYIQIKQYHSQDYRQIKDEISLYKKSNYTGLIQSKSYIKNTF